MTFKWPRRASVPHMTAGELAIRAAVHIVETVGCDVLLTDAVILLGQAQTKVAEYIDKCKPENATVEIGAAPEVTSRQNIYARTEPDCNYPQFVSVNVENDRVEMIVRSPVWGDGSCGDTAAAVLTREQARELGLKLLGL